MFLLFGVYAILSCFRAIDGVTFTAWIVYTGPVLAGILLWLGYYRVKNHWFFRCSLLAMLLFCAGYTALFYDTLKEQAAALADTLSGSALEEAVPVTTLAFLTGIVLTLLFFGFELLLRSHILLYILTTVLLILAPLLQVRLTVFDLVMLFLFQFFFWGLTWAENREQERKFGRRSVVMLVSLLVIFALAFIVAYRFQDTLYDFAYDVEGTITRRISQETGLSRMSMANGRISGGNRYQTGTEQIVLTSDRRPDEDLYLKGFSGGIYTGGNWSWYSDDLLFSDMMDDFDWAERQYEISIRFYLMYYIMNLQSADVKEEDVLKLQVRRVSNRFRSIFMPYDSIIHMDRDEEQTNESDDYSLEFYLFEQKDMHIQWDNVPEDFAEERDKYAKLQAAYIKAIQDPYTEVPKEKLPRLVKLVEEHPLTDLNDITAFILYTLSSNCTYSLTPGWAPLNEDIVEYFLFDNGKGFCEHFASTAALMYRLYGVPARYASGYKVSPAAFTQTEDGTYEARLTDENAHAWVEIFLTDYGWTPVEVTPSLSGQMGAAYPGFDEKDYEQILSDHGWEQDPLTWLAQAGNALNADGGGEAGDDWSLLPDLSGEAFPGGDGLYDLGMVLLVCLVYGLLFLPLILDRRRIRLIRKRQGESPRVTYDRLVRMLHFCGILQEYTGDEPDFPDRLLEHVFGVTKEEWQPFYELVSRMAYGSGETFEPEDWIRNEDLAAVKEIYRRIAGEMAGQLSWWRRQIFTYIMVFGG